MTKPHLRQDTRGHRYIHRPPFGWRFHSLVRSRPTNWNYAALPIGWSDLEEPLRGGLFGLRSHQLDGGDGA